MRIEVHIITRKSYNLKIIIRWRRGRNCLFPYYYNTLYVYIIQYIYIYIVVRQQSVVVSEEVVVLAYTSLYSLTEFHCAHCRRDFRKTNKYYRKIRRSPSGGLQSCAHNTPLRLASKIVTYKRRGDEVVMLSISEIVLYLHCDERDLRIKYKTVQHQHPPTTKIVILSVRISFQNQNKHVKCILMVKKIKRLISKNTL